MSEKKSRLKLWTLAGVAAFVAFFLFTLDADQANADEAYFQIGHSTFNGEMTIPAAGYRFDSGWDIGVGFFGDGKTKNGYNHRTPWASISYVTDPHWGGLYTRLGIAHTPDMNLVGDWNFRLGVGWDFGVWEVEVGHFSSAGTTRLNTGIDDVELRAMIKVPFTSGK